MLMNNKVCIVTGATNGLGQITAHALAKDGATLVIIARNEAKAKRTVEQISATTGNNRVSYLIADLSSTDQIRGVAQRFKEEHDELHLLVNNAGRFVASRKTSIDGFELTFATNHLNYFLLTHLLLDTMKASGTPETKSRIVNVASSAHLPVTLDFDDLQNESSYNARIAYGQTKLMNIMFTYELARRLAEEHAHVTVNAVHPGFVRTGLAGDNSGTLGLLYRITLFFLRPMQGRAEDGAQTLIYAATSEDIEGITGKYFVDCRIAATSDASMIATDWVRLWAISERMMGLS